MALNGMLYVKNNTNKRYRIYQGPRHKNLRGEAGPTSWVGFPVNDPHGNTYFRAVPTDGGSYIDKVIGTPAKTQVTWVIG
jgi:hypothetical protein